MLGKPRLREAQVRDTEGIAVSDQTRYTRRERIRERVEGEHRGHRWNGQIRWQDGSEEMGTQVLQRAHRLFRA